MTHPAVGLILGVGVGIKSLPHPLLRLTSFTGMINSEVLDFSPEYTIVGIHRPVSTVFIVPSFSRSTLPGDPIDASEMAFYSPRPSRMANV